MTQSRATEWAGPAGVSAGLDLVSGEEVEASGLGLLARVTERMLILEVSAGEAGKQTVRCGEPAWVIQTHQGCPLRLS